MDYAAHTYDLYHDIQQRTGGEIYIGVLGPVRTGKSTFIKRFMDELVLPSMEDGPAKVRAQDELPQSAGGRTITTTEPKFIPNEAAQIKLDDEIDVKVRLIDCVGYMVDGATGHLEDNQERMVKTPWFDYEIPFTQAAQIGTDKVMNDHSTIGLVITTDGSISDIPRNGYKEAEEKTILALKQLNKPFLVLVNSKKPYSEEAKNVAAEIMEQYQVSAMTVNCEQLKREDIHHILQNILYEFPVSSMEFYMPKWVEMMDVNNEMKTALIENAKELMKEYQSIRDVLSHPVEMHCDCVRRCKTDHIKLSDGVVKLYLDMDDAYYYNMLTEMLGENIADEYQLLAKLKEYADMKQEYTKVKNAVDAVRMKGYGVVTPVKDEIMLEKPEIIKHGNKFGVKIKAISPSIHMIKANIETEIAPIVGSKEQADDLIRYINQAEEEQGIWETNIFGKTVEQLVSDGITSKIMTITEDSQLKLQDTMQKIVNDSNGGMICIII